MEAVQEAGGATRRLDVFVTVGMGPYPFDRLIAAIADITERHDVYAQIGTATVAPPCPHRKFMAFDEFQRRLRSADVVVTHAGNTVRLVQSLGRVPVVVARRADLGEMANDHQVTYLTRERLLGRVAALDDVGQLASSVDGHLAVERAVVTERPLVAPVDGPTLIATLDRLLKPLISSNRVQRRRA